MLAACADDARSNADDGIAGPDTGSSDASTPDSSDDWDPPDLSDDGFETDGDGDPSGDGDGDGDPSGDGDIADCVPEAFVHAPAPTVIDGLDAVPIDILEIDAQLHFDPSSATAFAQGTMTFQMGETGGMPIFDVRQTPVDLQLDGQPLAPQFLVHHDFGVGLDAGFSILELSLTPCSVHTLGFTLTLAVPDAPGAAGLSFAAAPDRLYFDLFSSDLNPGRYLESWLPANMPWDRHPISIGVTIEGAGVEHTLISNALVDAIAPHAWQLEFPASSTTMDPMIVILPSDDLDSLGGAHQAANGQLIDYQVHVNTSAAIPSPVVASNVAAYLDAFVLSVGEYAHPAMTVYVYSTNRSMEYAGATTSAVAAIEHEVFHSWWARGLSPATYADGWIDEAWDMFNTGGQAFVPVPFDWLAEPTTLFDPHPFARETPDIAYSAGRLLFAGLADLMGVESLRAAMAEFYISAGPFASITTAQLEQHLYCASGELPEVRQAFHRFVYGLAGDAEAAADGYCG